jgi:hypothetical protein
MVCRMVDGEKCRRNDQLLLRGRSNAPGSRCRCWQEVFGDEGVGIFGQDSDVIAVKVAKCSQAEASGGQDMPGEE